MNSGLFQGRIPWAQLGVTPGTVMGVANLGWALKRRTRKCRRQWDAEDEEVICRVSPFHLHRGFCETAGRGWGDRSLEREVCSSNSCKSLLYMTASRTILQISESHLNWSLTSVSVTRGEE